MSERDNNPANNKPWPQPTSDVACNFGVVQVGDQMHVIIAVATAAGVSVNLQWPSKVAREFGRQISKMADEADAKIIAAAPSLIPA